MPGCIHDMPGCIHDNARRRLFSKSAPCAILFVFVSWLCVLLSVVLLIAWLHAPHRSAAVDLNVRVACLGLLACAVLWLLMHFVCADTEARWTATLLRGRLRPEDASEPLRTVRTAAESKELPPRNASAANSTFTWFSINSGGNELAGVPKWQANATGANASAVNATRRSP